MGNNSIKPQPQPSIQEEDWEKELEEISQRIENQNQPPYGNFMYKWCFIESLSHTFCNKLFMTVCLP